jgi:hypothetical protein
LAGAREMATTALGNHGKVFTHQKWNQRGTKLVGITGHQLSKQTPASRSLQKGRVLAVETAAKLG